MHKSKKGNLLMKCYEVIDYKLKEGIGAIENTNQRVLLHIGDRKFHGKLRTYDLTKIVVIKESLYDKYNVPNELRNESITGDNYPVIVEDVDVVDIPNSACLLYIRNHAPLDGKYRLKYTNRFRIIANGFCKFDLTEKTGNGNEYLGILFEGGSIIMQNGYFINNRLNNETILTKIKNINGQLEISKVKDAPPIEEDPPRGYRNQDSYNTRSRYIYHDDF